MVVMGSGCVPWDIDIFDFVLEWGNIRVVTNCKSGTDGMDIIIAGTSLHLDSAR